MNLFVCLWNAPEAWRMAATDAVKRMADVLPQLSADSARRVYPQCDDVADAGSHPVVATIQTAEAALGKRAYVAMDGPDLVLYDGAPVDPDGQIAGWSASALAACWEAAQNRLEGQFVLVRATPRSLQVLTDPLGLYPVYYWQQDRTWLVSNSIAVLRSITGERNWDPLGLSMAAVSGWAGADRTLTENIRVMPGGEVWSVGCDAVGVTKRRYFERAELARLSRAASNRADVPQLARTLRSVLRHASGRGGRLKCALTAGRDTRLLAAFLMAESLSAQYSDRRRSRQRRGPRRGTNRTAVRPRARRRGLLSRSDREPVARLGVANRPRERRPGQRLAGPQPCVRPHFGELA